MQTLKLMGSDAASLAAVLHLESGKKKPLISKIYTLNEARFL